MRVFLSVLIAALPWGASAQEDPMAVQRCVWRCLAGSPGAASPEYNQCVARSCGAQTAPKPQIRAPTPAPVRPAWRAGLASDGVHRFAGTDAEQGYGFYYFCTATTSFFTLTALPMQAGQYRFVIGTVAYQVPFDRSRGDLSVNIPPGSPFLQGVQSGSWLQVEALNGTPLVQFSLVGAGAAIAQAVQACFP